ncbi:hypothetical protein M7I_5509 [Glarea lozoyensis 74030]|uniref:Uncharacterized protein n=1 Tax=Glarea lozoyensis (strain ATCC 74030 / MF5533) TaxID=1104152 RepID=H0ES34_GLAL7|nr:hypothetical protein M7I_5509 [Glarea lozoyensis 74030]
MDELMTLDDEHSAGSLLLPGSEHWSVDMYGQTLSMRPTYMQGREFVLPDPTQDIFRGLKT